MTKTFENANDVIVYGLKKIIPFARENQYLFKANCVWWLAGVIGLDQGIIIRIDYLRARANTFRSISPTPRDMARIRSPPTQEYR